MRRVKPYGKDLNIKNPHTSEDDHGDTKELLAKHTAAEFGESPGLTMNDSVMIFSGISDYTCGSTDLQDRETRLTQTAVSCKFD